MHNKKTQISRMQTSLIKYKRDEHRAPVYIGTAQGYLAQRILELADEHGIEIIKDEELSNQLNRLKPGQEIPSELFQVFAEIIAMLWQKKSG